MIEITYVGEEHLQDTITLQHYKFTIRDHNDANEQQNRLISNIE